MPACAFALTVAASLLPNTIRSARAVSESPLVGQPPSSSAPQNFEKRAALIDDDTGTRGALKVAGVDFDVLGDGCQKFREYSVEGTKINKKKVEQYVGESIMLVTGLSPVIGYDKASKIAHQALDAGSTLKEAALKNGVDEAQYDKAINPREMAGHGVGGA